MHLPVSFVTFVDKANQWFYHVTDGRFGGQLLKYSMLLLQTSGRKSGQPRTHTLLYLRDGEDLIIIASNNGQDHYPGWYWNLLNNPHAIVQTGRRHYGVNARLVEGEEYERLWKKFLAANSLYADHRKRTTRHFPIFRLKPAEREE